MRRDGLRPLHLALGDFGAELQRRFQAGFGIALLNGCDQRGAVQGSETLPYLTNLEKNTYAIVGEPFTAVYQGIAFSKKDPALRDAYAAALKALMASGEYKAIYAKHGLEGTMLDGIYINGEAVK